MPSWWVDILTHVPLYPKVLAHITMTLPLSADFCPFLIPPGVDCQSFQFVEISLVFAGLHYLSVQFSTVTQLCSTLCNPMDCSTAASMSQTYVCRIGDASNHLILSRPFSSSPQSFPASGSFLVSQLVSSSGQSIGASASASVLPVNT